MAKNRLDITVAGVTLAVSTVEEEPYVLKLAESMDGDMQMLLEKGNGISVTSAAVLCAIDYLDKYQKANRSANNMRNQIKEYLADASNAKLMFDEEKKRTSALSSELASLRDEVSRMEPSDSLSREDLAKAIKEIEELRHINDDAVSQCRGLNDRVTALNNYIAGQDSELNNLRKQADEQQRRIEAQSQNLAELEKQTEFKQKEIERLNKELSTLETMIDEETARADRVPGRAPAPQRPLPQRPAPPKPQRPEPSFSQPAFDDTLFGDLPPDDYPNDGMPDLNWTDGLIR